MPKDLESWLAINHYVEGAVRTPMAGGCISQAWLVQAKNGEQIFIKYLDDVPERFYESEVEGLDYLGRVGNVVVPQVLGYGKSFIAMEYVTPAAQKPDFWEQLGHQLARLHGVTREQFGFVNDNYCGTSIQRNTYESDGYTFFGQHRLIYQADLALQNESLSPKQYEQILNIADQLGEWIPNQPASLLHGDLWSGNVHVSSKGEPVFIDPAVYFAWAEIDIAMTKLFGGFPDRFYQAYQEVRPLESAWQDRLSLYNLYPLLNHLNLFGSGYLDSIDVILKRYARN